MAMLLLVLLSAQHSSATWTSNIQNYAILSPVQDIVSVHSECDCRELCIQYDNCTAVTYDAVGDTCTLSGGSQSSLTTQRRVDTVTYAKFSYTPPAPQLFMSTDKSYNQSRADMVAMCAAQNGIPLIIRTTQQRAQAVQLVGTYGTWTIFSGGSYAFLSARDVLATEDPIWPDGTKVIGSVFTKSNIQIETKYGIATMLTSDGNVVITKEMNPNELHSLCEKYP
ncbi:uncharacterized protein LOC108676772 [Hyalella azteca]|uniref:Uncharacterized protein LOC108676772 n=1 Tax=Hyalella azteca TaxID=294128 RepID=A0A8B7P2Y8_HYAAZ|nr:uncharacterized protein LOC108676772 [Hyalella azteca]